MNKKTDWLILTFLFIFDNVWSFVAVSKYNLHEMNLIIAPVVEKYSLLYFLCIPIEVVGIYLIVWLLKKVLLKVLKDQKFDQLFVEKVILTSIVIYWSIGNSGVNLLSLLFGHLPPWTWFTLSVVGIITAMVYAYKAIAGNSAYIQKLKVN
jgi:hypothetical protein